jgi:hypothetical protein
MRFIATSVPQPTNSPQPSSSRECSEAASKRGEPAEDSSEGHPKSCGFAKHYAGSPARS